MKKLFFFAAVAMAAVLSCTKPEDKGGSTDEGVTATKIEFAEKNYTVVAGETVTLKLVATPENASLKGVELSSSKEDVATVDASAVVTGVKAGSVTITAKLGKLKATTKVKVEAVPVPATGIKVDKESVTVGVGKTVTVTASLLPEGTTDQLNATWTSADETVATVAGGVIRGVAEGTTTVTVAHGTFTATVVVTVEAGSLKDRTADWKATATARWQSSYYGAPTAVTDVVLEKCDASRFFFNVLDADQNFDLDAAQKVVEEEIARMREYEEDPLSIFFTSVPQTVTVRRTGTVTAYVLSYTDDLQFNDEFAVFSFNVADPDPVQATGIKLSESTLTLTEGKSTRLMASLEPEDCTDEPAFEWQSSDETVVTLSESYLSNYITVTAVAEGTATVTVTHGELSAKCEVTVEKDNVVWTKVDNWEYEYGKVEEYGEEYDGFILTSCSASQHAIVDFDEAYAEYYGVTGDMNSAEAAKAIAAYSGEYISYYTSSELPHGHAVYYDMGDTWIYVFGMENGAFTGEYMIVKYEPQGGDNPGGGDDPVDPQPGTEGTVVSLNGQYFPVDWDSVDATQSECTMEAWVNSSSFSGGKDDIYTVMGAEGMFLLRFEGNKLHLVYGGTPKNANEYNEINLSYDTAFSTNKWYHIAATYVSGGKVKLYVDGEEVKSGDAVERDLNLNGVDASYELPFKFYVGVSANNRFFKGSLAYLRVWDYARSAQEIKDNMNVADPEDDGYDLLASWKFNEGSGNTIKDYGASSDYTGNGGYVLNAISKDSDAATLNWVEGTLPF